MTIETFYEADKALTADEDFMEWFAELEGIISAFGKTVGEHPYGKPLAKSTGMKCWHDFYAEGFSPQDAFDEDRTYWE